MTAVDFIVQKLNPLVNAMPNDIYSTICNIIIEAKAMEKEQNILIYRRGYIDGVGETQLTNSVIKNK